MPRTWVDGGDTPVRGGEDMSGSEDICQRVERFVSFGAPTCDVCREFSREQRSDQSEFWPDEAIHYIRGDCDSAFEFWGVTVCPHHDEGFCPDDATHRVVDVPEYIGDDHQMNSAYEHNVRDITEVPQ